MNTQITPNLRPFRLAQLPLLALLAIVFAALPQVASATANYVYHERTTANPGGVGQYVTRLNPTSAETYPLLYKVEYQFYTDTARVYYTTDGSTPAGAFGTPSGTTAVLTSIYQSTFFSSPNTVDVLSNTIPAQPAGTVVKYIVSAWHSGGGSEIFANSGEFSSPFTTSSAATLFQYTVGSTTNLYWDSNGTTTGAGNPAHGSWGSTNFWSTTFDGTSTTNPWTSGRNAIFSAGTDATSSNNIALVGSQTAGALTIEEGTISFLASNSVTLAAGPATVNSGATLVMDSSARVSQTAGSVWTLNGGTIRNANSGIGGSFVDIDSTIVLGAAGGTLSATVSNSLNIVETGVVISGTGSLTKTGIGVVALASSNIYSGATIISDGELRMRTTINRLPTNTDVTISSTGILNLNAIPTTIGSLSGSGRVGFGGATLHINGNSNTVFSGSLSNNANYGASGSTTTPGRISKRGSGELTLTGINTITGTITNFEGAINVAPGATLSDPTLDLIVNGGSVNLSNVTQTVLSLTGTGGTVNLGSGHALTLNTSSTKVFSGVLSGPGSLVKSNTGLLTLDGSNTFSGGLSFVGGSINFNHNSAAGSGTITVASTAAEIKSTVPGIILPNAIVLSSGANPKYYSTSGNAIDQVGVISGPGALTRDDTGAGTVTLSGSNTFSGGFSWTSRTLRLNNKNALGTGLFGIGGVSAPTTPPLTLTAVSTLAGSDSLTNAVAINQDFTFAAVSSAQFNGPMTMPATRNISVNSGVTLTFSGAISNTTAGLNKWGLGTLTLGGSNAYTGSTLVSTGMLVVNGSLAAGTVTVASGTTLGGNGSIGGAITVSSGGTLAPGTSIGTLTNGSAPTLSGTILAEINRTNAQTADKIVFNGGATLNGTLTLTNLGPAAQNGDTFDLFDGAVGGAFTTLNLPPGGLGHWKTNNLVVNGTITFTNNAPAAQNLTAGVVQGGTVVLPVIGGKNSATDADGDAFSVTAVSTPGSGSASFGASNVTYVASGTTGTNTFTYTVTDALGAANTKTVTVVVGDPQGFNQVSAGVDGGNAVLTYLGLPGTNYALDVTHALPATNWVPVISNAASGIGYLYFTNLISLAPTNDYYRTRYVP